MENIVLLTLSISFTAVIGVIGYFLRSIHVEVKEFIKELTEYTNKLKQLIVGIQTQIDKGIEADISEIKDDLRTLTDKVQQNTTLLNQKNTNL